MGARAVPKFIGALTVAGALMAADGAFAQVRAGFGGVRAVGARGFSSGPARPMSPPPTISRPMLPGSSRGLGGRTFFDSRGRTFIDGSGLTVNGSFEDDHFRLRFRLGTPTGLVRGHDWCGVPGHSHKHHFCPTPVFPYPYFGYSYYNEPAYPIDGYYAPLDPQLIGYTPRPTPPENPPPPPAPREIGDAALYSGYPERAIQEYRTHLATNPDDAQVIRLLGLALIDARDVKEGVAVVRLAYRKNPSLCETPVPPHVFGDRSALRTNVNRVSIYARNVNSASAWLAMAVLVQAEGRRDVAVRMIERARAAGLEKSLADRMVTALAK